MRVAVAEGDRAERRFRQHCSSFARSGRTPDGGLAALHRIIFALYFKIFHIFH